MTRLTRMTGKVVIRMAVELQVVKAKDREAGLTTVNQALVETVSESGINGQAMVHLFSGTALIVKGTRAEVSELLWPAPKDADEPKKPATPGKK